MKTKIVIIIVVVVLAGATGAIGIPGVCYGIAQEAKLPNPGLTTDGRLVHIFDFW